MKTRRNNSNCASALQIALSSGLISISAILLAIAAPATREKAPRHDLDGFELEGGTPADASTTLGNYPPTSVSLSGDTTVTPDAAPTNTTSVNVSTNSNFNGTFAASPTTGVVTVTNAHPADSYAVAVTAFGPGGTTTKTFTLTVSSIACGAGFNTGFTNAADVNVGDSPALVAIADFNGDGKQDLAVADFGSDTVSIRLGDGMGGFSGSTEVSVGPAPYSVAIGDFNGDGKQDLAVVKLVGNTVSIRLGDGSGGFSGSTEVSVGSNPFSVAVGDFNGDGKQDLAVVNQNSNAVSIRLGDGMGGFSGSTEVGVGFHPYSIAIGDFNGDGKQDLAVTNLPPNTVSIRLGDGLGGFSGSTEVIIVSLGPVSVAVGDFNGDGKQDLAVAGYGSDTVSIRLGDGLGGFSGSTEVSVGSWPQSVVIGDFNGDGKQDLAVANQNSNTVSIRLGACIPVPTPTPTPTPTPGPAQAINLSTRMRVLTDANVGIGGFIIAGTDPKTVLLRGIGPSLSNFGVPDPLADPVMELHGPKGFTTIVNNDWRDTQGAFIKATGLAPTNDLESAILATLDPGPYTAIVRGNNSGTGVGLVEAYDLAQFTDSKLANISTRAFVGTGNDIMIAGFILGGNTQPDNVIVRGIGPSLAAFGVPNPLANPTLELRDQNGSLIRANDDWQDDPAQAALISAAGLAPTNPLESAIAATLSPGLYTALMAELNNGTGVGLVEVYDRGGMASIGMVKGPGRRVDSLRTPFSVP